MFNTTYYYYVIHTNESYSSLPNVKPRVMLMTEAGIVDAADYELCRRGESLYDLAGIGYVKGENGLDYPARSLSHTEAFELSVRALKHDGRLFHVFKTDSEGEKNFINEARYYGIESEAIELVNEIKLLGIIIDSYSWNNNT
jgi:hypothetical protein